MSDRDKDKQISVSREAMLGFLGHGHPHSAVWFMELLMAFEEATGVRAKADPEQATRLSYVEAREKLAGAFSARRDLLSLIAEHLDEFPEEYRGALREILTQLQEALSGFTFDPDLATAPTDRMLERAARAHYEQRYPEHTFDAQPESVKDACRDAVRPVLAAALGGERPMPCTDHLTFEEAREKVSGPLHTFASTIGRLRVAVDSDDPGVEHDLTDAAGAVGELRNTFNPEPGSPASGSSPRRPVVYVREQEGSSTELFATVEEAMDGPWEFEDRFLASAGDPWHCEETDPETELGTAWIACPKCEAEVRVTAVEIPDGCQPYPTLEEIESGAWR